MWGKRQIFPPKQRVNTKKSPAFGCFFFFFNAYVFKYSLTKLNFFILLLHIAFPVYIFKNCFQMKKEGVGEVTTYLFQSIALHGFYSDDAHFSRQKSNALPNMVPIKFNHHYLKSCFPLFLPYLSGMWFKVFSEGNFYPRFLVFPPSHIFQRQSVFSSNERDNA